jgi:hypothetical protein
VTRVDPHLSDPLALAHRQRDYRRSDHLLDQGPVDPDDPTVRRTGDEGERLASIRRLRGRVHPLPLDEVDRPIPGEAPREQRGEIAVAALACRPAEQRGVDRHAVGARRRDLRPAGGAGVAGLDAEEAREAGEQVVPRRQRAAPGNRRGRVTDDGADHLVAHGDPGEPGHVAGARVVARRVEAVRVGEMRVAQAQLSCLRVHHRDEAGLAPADVLGQCDGGVVRALDQRGLDQVVNGQPLARPEVDR